MLQAYADITDEMTSQLREIHYLHYLWQDDGHEGRHPLCTSFSYDLLHGTDRRCCACVAVPVWWDEYGTPRYVPHHPSFSPDIYINEIVLLEIACQACGKEFLTQLHRSGLPHKIREGSIHYGDPPAHEGCAAGDTMNCNDLRVVEFWERSGLIWQRVPELEIEPCLSGSHPRST